MYISKRGKPLSRIFHCYYFVFMQCLVECAITRLRDKFLANFLMMAQYSQPVFFRVINSLLSEYYHEFVG